MPRPMLGNLELTQVQRLEVDEVETTSWDRIPGLETDFLQVLGRRCSRVVLAGVLSGPEAAADLKALRETFRAAEPVAFTPDLAAATRLDQVVIEGLVAEELAGRPERVGYVLSLREHLAPPPAEQQAAEPLPNPVDEAVAADAATAVQEQVQEVAAQLGTIEVTVELGPGELDYTGIVVWVEGETGDGTAYSVWSGEQAAGVYTFTDVPAGSYDVRLELR